jgi:hypothetical protein
MYTQISHHLVKKVTLASIEIGKIVCVLGISAKH